MTLRVEQERVRLVGVCGVEEAEPLAALLLSDPKLRIDVSQCESIHAAVAQALLAFQPSVEGAPNDPFVLNLMTQIANLE